MATEALASCSYRLAKSWQYEDNFPEPPPLPPTRTEVANARSNLGRPRSHVIQHSNSLSGDSSCHGAEVEDRPLLAGESPVRPAEAVRGRARRQRKHDSDDGDMSGGARCCFGLFILLAQILLNGVMGLCLYWVIKFHSNKDGVPFSWKEDPNLEFNLHPVLMTAGFIYFMGQAMLMYRTCRCCRRIWNKLLHTIFHILAIPCVAIGFLAVLDSHNLRKDSQGNIAPIPNFYSLHSWMGLATMGLFCLQFVVGFFSFLLLLCCESATASFRASLVPIHSTFGITTFMLAIATACAGLTEKAFFSLSTRENDDSDVVRIDEVADQYPEFLKTGEITQGLVINVLGAGFVALGILIPWIIGCKAFRKGLPREGERSRDNNAI